MLYKGANKVVKGVEVLKNPYRDMFFNILSWSFGKLVNFAVLIIKFTV